MMIYGFLCIFKPLEIQASQKTLPFNRVILIKYYVSKESISI